ncbi:peptidase M24 [Pirellula staleyi DSM 6068]|uniref:Peptidase M24 n=1 Tax=Pirellula staleyi (strain ATCC 27377 / DSM 6068 / ICPB 4128) TaxID=530564 RepID=D2R8J4_PIRSD|nr:M24 family metallopeptidase [Pirellula staleyi]ADB17535.1 peptidase M24 [Pirellula staleyi DSM 6068]
MFDLAKVQAALHQFGLDGWLIGEFRGSNMPGRRVLDFADRSITSRRWFYSIPREGKPLKLVHRIEPGALDHLPGETIVYLRWQEFEAGIAALCAGKKKIAMEYSPKNNIPYIARVDAGTIELVRSQGCDVVSSGNLIQLFESVWDESQWEMHLLANKNNVAAYDRAWKLIADRIESGKPVTEGDVCGEILQHFAEHAMTTYHPPIVGVGPHSGDPHYETSPDSKTPIKRGDFVLIDLWAKLDQPRAVYSDLTRVGFVGTEVPEQFNKVFKIVAAARDAAIAYVQEAFASGRPLQGWEVDDACREVIVKAGYGDYFIHRTGHSIGQETHGNGANIDNLETHEDRLILPGSCFSIEPGIYLPEFGARSEVDVFVDWSGNVHVTGGPLQTEVLPILAK